MIDLTSVLLQISWTAVGFDLDNPIAAIDLQRHVVEERPACERFESWETVSIAESAQCPPCSMPGATPVAPEVKRRRIVTCFSRHSSRRQVTPKKTTTEAKGILRVDESPFFSCPSLPSLPISEASDADTTCSPKPSFESLAMKYQIEPPYYPIVYVRGYAMRADEREETFYDTYYGFAATSVEKRQAPPPKYWEADMFEGQLIRFMKLRNYAYADAVNRGESIPPSAPSRSLWVCRFYDRDYFEDKIRSIEDHARELRDLVCTEIPARLTAAGVDLGAKNENYKVILIAHSMGGLVCRTFIQNILPLEDEEDPKKWIHRLVTMGTPHRGIELSLIPDFIQRAIAENLNPFDSNIFSAGRMRQYLKLEDNYAVHSLGDEKSPRVFPVKRCLCLIGSDHGSYGAVRYATGSYSDGLVKQSNAYVVSGPDPGEGKEYGDEHTAYYANVHRAHSGRRGIVNSYESFENIQRFLFGDIKIRISLDNIEVVTPVEDGVDAFYDFEFLFSIRRSNAFLHRRQQDPCENALRFQRERLPKTLLLHTAFMNSALKDEGDEQYSHFSMRFRVLERKVKHGMFWDTDYPERQIYSEGLEVRVGDENLKEADTEVGYRWLSDSGEWNRADPSQDGVYRLALRGVGAIKADLVIEVAPWPNNDVTRDR